MNDLHALAAFKALDEGRLQPVDKGVVVTQADVELLAQITEAGGNKAAAFTLRSVGAVGTVLEAQAKAIAHHRHQSETGAALTSDGREAKEVVLFNLTWIAPPSPELPDDRRVHPEPMTGRQAFTSWEKAQTFMSKRCEGSEFVSLTQTTSRTVDRSAEFAAVLAQPVETGAALLSVNEKSVMVCPQCEGEGGYPDGLDEAACHTDCTRCDGNGWIVDIAALAQPVEAKCPKCWCRELAPLDDGSGSRCVNCKHVQPVEAGEDGHHG